MKILIEGNFNNLNTRPNYLNDIINQINGYEAEIRRTDVSFYDFVDEYDPNVYITDANMITKDCVQYLSGNKNIVTVINISDIMMKHIRDLDVIVKDMNINCKFFISNRFNHKELILNTKTAIYKVMECYDEHLDQRKSSVIESLGFKYPNYVYSDEDNGLITNYPEGVENFHSISCLHDKESNVDISFGFDMVEKMIKSYEQGIFYLDTHIPQMFFHSIMSNNLTKFYCNTKEKQAIESVFSKIFATEESMHIDDYAANQENLRKTILEKHTSLNRAKRILSQLN